MKRTTAWLCLLGGVLLLIEGGIKLFYQGDWVLLILSILIIAFSATSLVKKKIED